MTHSLALDYPVLKTDDVVEDYFGHRMADPYRWLEAFDSAEARAFVEQQNVLTKGWIPSEVRGEYLGELRKVVDFPRRSLPTHYGKVWVTTRNSGLQAHSVLYKQDEPEDEAKVLLDPNTFSKDGTVSLASTSFTRDGRLMAYGKSVGGGDDQTIFVREVATDRDLPDVLENMRFSSVAWAPDGTGFWYNRFPDPEVRRNSTVYWHKLGTKQSEDVAVMTLPDEPEVDLYPWVTEDGRYLLLYKSEGTSEKNGILVREVAGGPERVGDFREVFPLGVANFVVVQTEGTTLYVYTDKDAPRRRLVAVDVNVPEVEKWREILPQSEDLLTDVALVGGRFATVYTRDVHSVLKVYEKDGTFVREVELPTAGTVGGLSGRPEDGEMYFVFSSYTYPGTIYRHDMATGETERYYQSQVAFRPEDYVTEQIFCTSKDGTRVPVFVVRHKDTPKDGKNPTVLYGYGGFGINLSPGFQPSIVPWLDHGGVYAVANLRGGAEYGTEWHEAGMLGRKQNVFDDFIAAAEKLVADRYTSAEKLAIEGGSNGGLLVAAVLLQRPELFGAAVSQVPVMDMLRYQKFGTGRYWTMEYGDATASAEAFAWLKAYSPLHNVKSGQKYPPLLVTTADGDDRVVPSHAFKFVATMQAEAEDGVYLLRHETGSGHGGGKPLDRVLEEQADVYAFLTRALKK